jgi:hypothetical protein
VHHHSHPEVLPPPSGEGTVVLDVGGNRGAVIIFTAEMMDGEEIEIRPVAGPWDGTHTAVRRRDLRDSVAFAGVFGSVAAGKYQARVKQRTDARRGVDATVDLQVTGGEVTELHWPVG